MGVRGLGTFVDEHSAFDRFENLVSAAHDSNVNASLVIDGLSLCHYLRNNTKCFPYILCIRTFADVAREFLQSMFAAGVTAIVVVFDGCHETIKYSTRRDRRLKRWDAMKSFIAETRHGHLPASSTRDLTSISLFRMALIDVLNSLPAVQIKIITGIGEADKLAAQIARAERHFAILAEDSDYLLMNVRYFPLSSYFVAENQSIHGKVFTPERISKVFSIPTSSFSALACLCGNDYIHGQELESIWAKLGLQLKGRGGNTGGPASVIKRILTFLRSKQFSEANLQRTLLGNGSHNSAKVWQKIGHARVMYDTNGDPDLSLPDWMENAKFPDMASQFRAGLIHPGIPGIFQSRMNWLPIFPYNSADNHVYDLWRPLRLRALGLICSVFGPPSSEVIFQEDRPSCKLRKVCPEYESSDGSWRAETVLADCFADAQSSKRQNFFRTTLLYSSESRFFKLMMEEHAQKEEGEEESDNILLVCSCLAHLLEAHSHPESSLKEDVPLLSEDEIELLLLHFFCVLDDEAFRFASLRARSRGRVVPDAHLVHLMSMIAIGLETCMMINQLCGSALKIKFDRLFDGMVLLNMKILYGEVVERFPHLLTNTRRWKRRLLSP